MGGKQTKGAKEAIIEHPQFEKAKITEVSGKDTLQTVVSAQGKVYNEWKKHQPKIQNAEYLLLPNKHALKTQGLCGDTGHLTVDFPCYPYILMTEIRTKDMQKKHFIEGDLWYLLHHLSEAKSEMLDKFSSTLGDVRPHNIFLSEKGDLKVLNLQSFPGEQNNFSKSFQGIPTYLAPQQVISMDKGQIQGDNNHTAEMFSIGLTALSVAQLKDYSDLYDTKNRRMNTEKLERIINEWRCETRYSEILRATITSLLHYNPHQRLSHQELSEILRKHQKAIIKKEIFTIFEAPEKLHQQVQQLREIVPKLMQQTSTTYGGNSIISSKIPVSVPVNRSPERRVI